MTNLERNNLERNKLNIGNYKSEDYKPKKSFWDKVKHFISSIFPF